MANDVIDLPKRSGPGVGHRPRKRAGETTTVTSADFESADEVQNLRALKKRMAQMLARPDISERDFATLNKDYRKVIVELKDAEDRAEAAKLGRRRGTKVAGGRSFDGDI